MRTRDVVILALFFIIAAILWFLHDAKALPIGGAGNSNPERLIGNTYNSISTGTSDNDKLVTQGYVDDATIFGTQFQQNYVAAETSTTSATFQQKLRVTTPVIPAGTYRIGVTYNWSVDSANVGAEFRVEIDDTTTVFDETPVVVKNYASGEYPRTGSFVEVALTNAAHTIDLDYRNTNGNTTYIKEARLEIWRVP